jgi:hypothetical protein
MKYPLLAKVGAIALVGLMPLFAWLRVSDEGAARPRQRPAKDAQA